MSAPSHIIVTITEMVDAFQTFLLYTVIFILLQGAVARPTTHLTHLFKYPVGGSVCKILSFTEGGSVYKILYFTVGGSVFEILSFTVGWSAYKSNIFYCIDYYKENILLRVFTRQKSIPWLNTPEENSID